MEMRAEDVNSGRREAKIEAKNEDAGTVLKVTAICTLALSSTHNPLFNLS